MLGQLEEALDSAFGAGELPMAGAVQVEGRAGEPCLRRRLPSAW